MRGACSGGRRPTATTTLASTATTATSWAFDPSLKQPIVYHMNYTYNIHVYVKDVYVYVCVTYTYLTRA